MALKIAKSRSWYLFTKYSDDIVVAIFILAFIFIIGYKLGAWSGDLKGDDAYYHVSRVYLILANFPHLNWFNQSFAGYDPLAFEAPCVYFLIALVYKITSLPIETLFQVILFLAMVSSGLSVYALARWLGMPRFVSLGFSLIIFAIPETWNWFIIGGAYRRIVALPLFFLSIGMAYRHIQSINDLPSSPGAGHSARIYIITIVVLSGLAMLHPLLWQWAFLMLLLAYALGIEQVRKKISSLAKTFLPVAAITAWMYIPLALGYRREFYPPGQDVASHDTTNLAWSWLISIPSPERWSNALGIVVLPVALFFLLLLLIRLPALLRASRRIRLKLIFMAIMGLFSLYFLAFGWLPMPKTWYLMASFDYGIFLGFSALLFSLFACSVLFEIDTFKSKHTLAVSGLNVIIVALLILGNIVNMPFLSAYVSITNPDNPLSLANSYKRAVDTALSSNIEDYRLHNSQRRLQAWLPLNSNVLSSGGRNRNDAPYKYYNQWADASLSYRFISEETDKFYFDDKPQFWRPVIGGEENYYSPMFWLDWYAAKGVILAPSIYPQGQTSQGYAGRPQFFQQFRTQTSFGDLFYYRYRASSPITVSSQALTVAVPYQSEDAPGFYTDLLDLLSALNLNSQWVIPIKLENDRDLGQFPLAMVEYDLYLKNQFSLDSYAKNGGALIIVGNGSPGAQELEVRVLNPNISFNARAEVRNAPEGSAVLAISQDGPVAYRTAVGKGSITYLGVTLHNLINANSAGATVLLVNSLGPELNWKNSVADLKSSNVSLATEGMVGGVSYSSAYPERKIIPVAWNESGSTVNALGRKFDQGEYESFSVEFNGGEARDQVNFTALLSDEVSLKTNGYLAFNIWSDSLPAVEVGFLSDRRDKYNIYPVKLIKGQWTRVLLPLAALNYPGADFTTSRVLFLSVSENPAAGISGNGEKINLQVNNLNIRTSDVLDTASPSLIFVNNFSAAHNQINWKFPLSQSVAANSNSVVSFALWNDGQPLSGIGIALGQDGKSGNLYYDLPEKIWNGWRQVAIPMSQFQNKDREQISSVNSLIFCFNDDLAPTPERKIRQLTVRDAQITTLNGAPNYTGLKGHWEQANKYTLELGEKKEVLWKETFNPDWQVHDDKGREIRYYFAGPGMLYLSAPGDASAVTFEMPWPLNRVIGLIISVLSLICLITYFIRKVTVARRQDTTVEAPW